MATSLAKQLKGLKSKQHDQIKLPTRSKVSFLFDIKEAYKIEDELVYTLCLKGIDELGVEYPKLKLQLESYNDDIFYEGSKDFYRGNKQKDDLEKLDRQLKNVITLISPYFMHPASYKILEFLIRVYDVQAHHKVHLFFSFLPFYETPQFLRLIQCMELKSDPMLKFFEPFAFKGIKLRLEALIKFMARENGAYLKSVSDIVFKFLEFREDYKSLLKKATDSNTYGIDQLNLDDEYDHVPHYKFWGTLVFKIIADDEKSRSESYLYTLIPSIAKALSSEITDLQVGALSIISILSEKLPLSSEYMNAFLVEICKSASKSLDYNESDTYFNLCTKTCLRMMHSQQIIPMLSKRLSMYSFNLGTSKYTLNPDHDASKSKSDIGQLYKWIGDLIKHQDAFLKYFMQSDTSDMTPLIFKCIEYYIMNEIEPSESIKMLSKVIGLQNPSQQLYKVIMSYCLAIVAGHLPEWQNDNASKTAVLVLDYLENRDSFIYVQLLDTLLKGHTQKHKILEKIEEIEIEQLGKAREKIITVESGVTDNDSMPVLLALYHKKKTVKKAALLSLYQQWIENDNVLIGKDLRMISSILVQFVEDQESEDIIIVTLVLLEYLQEKQLLSDTLNNRLFKILSTEYFPDHFPGDRHYSSDSFMKATNICLNLPVDQNHNNTKILIYLLWCSSTTCKSLLKASKYSSMISENSELEQTLELADGLTLLTTLCSSPKLSDLNNGWLWNLFSNYFSVTLKQSSTDPFICALSYIDSLKSLKVQPTSESAWNLLGMFIGKLPSLSNESRPAAERIRSSDVIIQALNIHANGIVSIFEALIVKHLEGDSSKIVDYLLTLYHSCQNSTEVVAGQIRTCCLLFISRTLDKTTSLETRTQIMSQHFISFICAMSDSNSQCRSLGQNMLKMYENYESFAKLLKSIKPKASNIRLFDFLIKKKKGSKKQATKKIGEILDKLEEIIDDIASKSHGEIHHDSGYVKRLVKFEKNQLMFEYFIYAIENVQTPYELQSYLRFVKEMQMSSEQLKMFWNALSSVEFDSTILGKDNTYVYMPSLVEVLLHQESKTDEISVLIHDWLLGLLDQHNAKEFKFSDHYILRIVKKLVIISSQYASRNDPKSDNFISIYKQIRQTLDVIHSCLLQESSPVFYLKSLCIELLKSLQDEYMTELIEEITSKISSKLVFDVDKFSKFIFILESMQSVTLKPHTMPYLLELLKSIGKVISSIDSSKNNNSLIEILIICINLAQSVLTEAKSDKTTQIKTQYGTYIEIMINIFKDQIEELTKVYTNYAKVDLTEGLIDPVQEFLQKDSLLTSAQKERMQDAEMSDAGEDKEIGNQKDVLLYQSLSTLLLFISNLQTEIGLGKKIYVDEIMNSVSESLNKLQKLCENQEYSTQSLSSSINSLLKLQTSAFFKNVMKCLENEDISSYNSFINESINLYISNISSFSDTIINKHKLINDYLKLTPVMHIEKVFSLTLMLLIAKTLENAKIKFNEEDKKSKIFEIENHEFKIAQKILYSIMKSESSIDVLRHFIMMSNFIPVMSKLTFKAEYKQVSEFIVKKVNLTFTNAYCEQVHSDSNWIEGMFAKQNQLAKLKYMFLVLLEDILPKQSHSEKYGQDRHPLVHTFQKLSINKHEDVTVNLKDLILAFDLGTTIIEFQQGVINDLKKTTTTSSNLKKAIQGNQDKKAISKLSKSVERLVEHYRKFNQDFVGTLIPLRLYVPVVTSILNYSDELMLLKTRSVNILWNYTPTFKDISSGTTYVDGHRLDQNLTNCYSKLIIKLSSILNSLVTQTKQKAVQTYLQSIILLLQKLICLDHQDDIQTHILPQIFKICHTTENTLLSCSAIMFVTSAFDVFTVDVLQQEEDFMNEIAITKAIENLKRVLPGGSEDKEWYANSVITSVLESYSLLMKSMYKFFTPSQLTYVLSTFFSIPSDRVEGGETTITGLIEKIFNLIAKNIDAQVSLHAVFNSFDFIYTKPEIFTPSEAKLKVYCQRYFSCIGKIFRSLKKEFVEEYHEGIAKFMNKWFLIIPTWEKNTGIDVQHTEPILNPVLLSFRAFILKLNEVQLKPLFLKLVKWAKKPVDKTSEKPVKDIDRIYAFFRACNILLETLMSIFSPYITYYIDLLTETFASSNFSKISKQKGNAFLDPENSRMNIIMVINSLLETIRLNYNTESSIPPEYFERVSATLLHVMDYYITKGTMNKDQYLSWINDIYQPTIVDVLSSMDNEQINRSFLDDMLRKSKHNNAAVRLATMKITEALLYKLEERFLTLLSDVIPYVSEAFEDTNEEVEQTARTIVHKIESMTGESIAEYLK